MLYFMEYNIVIGGYKVNTLKSVTIKKSVEQLSDTATIVVPGTLVNNALEVEDKINVGDKVSIKIGYTESTHQTYGGVDTEGNILYSQEKEGGLVEEFTGYVKKINTDDTDINIECEDELYLFDVTLQDAKYSNISLKSLLQKIVVQIDKKYKVSCDYAYTYKDFTVSHATALDVLKKIQDETKANIYFEGNTLHLHPQYGDGSWSGNIVTYNFALNVISSELKYVLAKDHKIKVQVEYTDEKGKVIKSEVGTDGGRTIRKTVNTNSEAEMKKVAENEYNLWCYDGYEGSITGWLIPYCKPTDSVELIDNSYSVKNGRYYIVATDVEFSSSGGRRKVTIGRKVE